MKKYRFYLAAFISLVLSGLQLQAKDYKGAEIYSNQSYLYGRFEMRLQSAPGSGQLSTFFLYRNSSETNTTLWQEIDIEIFGKNSNQFQTNVIVEKVEGTRSMTEAKHTTPNSTQEFNTYVLEWTPDSINWYVNDSLYRTEKTNALYCNAAMSLRFNHWVANNTGWVGSFDKTVLPTFQLVDYISYSSYTPGTGDNGGDYTLEWTDDFDSFNSTRWSKANWTFGENLCDFLPANAYTEDGNLVLKLHSTIVVPTQLEDVSSDEVIIYPNPFTHDFTIVTEDDFVFEIYSEQGTLLISTQNFVSAGTNTVTHLTNAATGKYYLKLYKNNKPAKQFVLIKE